MDSEFRFQKKKARFYYLFSLHSYTWKSRLKTPTNLQWPACIFEGMISKISQKNLPFLLLLFSWLKKNTGKKREKCPNFFFFFFCQKPENDFYFETISEFFIETIVLSIQLVREPPKIDSFDTHLFIHKIYRWSIFITLATLFLSFPSFFFLHSFFNFYWKVSESRRFVPRWTRYCLLPFHFKFYFQSIQDQYKRLMVFSFSILYIAIGDLHNFTNEKALITHKNKSRLVIGYWLSFEMEPVLSLFFFFFFFSLLQ
jgi:hypothetical protein